MYYCLINNLRDNIQRILDQYQYYINIFYKLHELHFFKNLTWDRVVRGVLFMSKTIDSFPLIIRCCSCSLHFTYRSFTLVLSIYLLIFTIIYLYVFYLYLYHSFTRSLKLTTSNFWSRHFKSWSSHFSLWWMKIRVVSKNFKPGNEYITVEVCMLWLEYEF